MSFEDTRADLRAIRSDLAGLRRRLLEEVEDVGELVVPAFLREEEGIDLVGILEPVNIAVDDTEVALGLLGRGWRGPELVAIGVEMMLHAGLAEIDALIERNRRIEKGHPGPWIWVLFSKRLERPARIRAEEAGIRLVPWHYAFTSRRPPG